MLMTALIVQFPTSIRSGPMSEMIEKFCQYVLDLKTTEYHIVGRDKERGVGQIKVTRWPLEISISNFRATQMSVVHLPSTGQRPSDNLESETFIIPATYERQVNELINNVCGMTQQKNLEKLWASLSN